MDNKSLLLFRHGKAAAGSATGRDFDRPLAEKGAVDAGRMGLFLSGSPWMPGLVLSSSALRARMTAEAALQAGDWQAELQLTDALYNASRGEVLGVIQALPDTAATVLLVGHEPAFSELAAWLSGGGQVKMSTSAMAGLRLPVSRWTDVRPGDATLHWLMQVGMLG